MTTKGTGSGARGRIEGAAVDLMAKKGIAGTTTQDIARRAGCSQAAIYKYWDSKESLARERFETANQAMIEAMELGAQGPSGHSGRILGALTGLLGFARANPSEYAFLFQVFHSDYARWLAALMKPRDVMVRELEAGMAKGEIPVANVEIKAALLLGMAVRLAFFERQKLVRGKPIELDEGLVQAAAAVLEN